jgi:hypothetical protein
MRPAVKQYLATLIPTMLVYLALVALSVMLLRHLGSSASWNLRTLVALAPMLPMLLAAAAFVRYLRRCDELEQRIELEAIAAAALTTSLGFLAVGTLAGASLLNVDAGASAMLVFPILLCSYALIRVLVSRRYQ